jgi:hypothetical protein
MNVLVKQGYGSQSMAAPLRRVLMRSAASGPVHPDKGEGLVMGQRFPEAAKQSTGRPT